MSKPVIAIAGLTACFGCQLTILNCEDELADLARMFTFAYFPMGMSQHGFQGEFDAALVEGAVSTPEDLETLVRLRSRSGSLFAVGTCARWGGINAMKNGEPRLSLVTRVYGSDGAAIATFNPGPLHRFVSVDGYVTGCPPEKKEMLLLFRALLHGTKPNLPDYPVCMECRMRENLCLLIEKDQLCLGPLIRAGCNARCPAVATPCEGCRGPVTEANIAAETDLLVEKGFRREEIASRMQRFCVEWSYGQDS
jgi:coenzyme F420-reducing hydrogenase gamma subunit